MVSRSAAITVWPSFSSIYPSSRYTSRLVNVYIYIYIHMCIYIYIYIYIYTHTSTYLCMCIYTHSPTFETTSHTSSFVVPSNFCDVFAAFSPSRLHPPARPKRIRSSARKGFPGIHANFNLFGYASRPLPRWGKSAFDDDIGEINETIGLYVTFKSRLWHRSLLDLLGYSINSLD